ncbi:HAMP domain-containing protein, partial [Escherichia fergusonii]
FYLFYYLMEVFYPRWYDEPETIMPSGLEWLWIGLTATVVVALATLIASRLTRRIITPLNSVAASLRRVASGDLEARARGGDTS